MVDVYYVLETDIFIMERMEAKECCVEGLKIYLIFAADGG